MAKLFQRKDAKVEKLIKTFRDSFGSKIVVYDAEGNVVSDSISLGAAGLKESGAFECRSSLTVGSFIERMAERGLIVKVFTTDDVEVIPGVTLETSGKITGCTPEQMEKYNAYSRNKAAEPAAEQPAAQLEVVAQPTTEAQGPVNLPALLDIAAFVFFFKYKVGGKDAQLRVDIVDDDLAVSNRGYEDESPVQITDDGFFIPEENRPAVPFSNPAINDCVDYDECGILLAKHFIKDNDGEVLMTIGFLDEDDLTLKETFSTEIKLTKGLNFALTDDTPCPGTLILHNNNGGNIEEYSFYEIEKLEDLKAIKDLLDDNEDPYDYLSENDIDYFQCRNYAMIWDEGSYAWVLKKRQEEDEIEISEHRLFKYGPWPLFRGLRRPKALLIRVNEASCSGYYFKVPEDFRIENCHFFDFSDLRKEFDFDWLGDGITALSQFKYNGRTFYEDDCFDNDFSQKGWALFVYNPGRRKFQLEAGVSNTHASFPKPYFHDELDYTQIFGDPEKEIHESQYSENTELKSFEVPDGFTKICDNAFRGCSNLASVTIPSSVTEIGRWAFIDCSALKSMVIPEGVSLIAAAAFGNCEALKSIVIPNSVIDIDENAFRGCSALESVVIPDGITIIKDSTFRDCSALKSVVIPDSVTEIEQYAFRGCSALECIILPKKLTFIGQGAFYGCSALKSMEIPESVTRIGDYAFNGCSELKSAVIPNRNTKIGSCVFSGCQFDYCVGTTILNVSSVNAGKYTFPQGITIIGESALSNNTNIESVVIPDGVTEIEKSAFEDCTALKSVEISNSVTKIGRSAFRGCAALESVVIPDSVTEIGDCIFSGCTALKSVVISKNIATISEDAFNGCAALQSVVIPNSVKVIDDSAFNECTALQSVVIPDSVTEINRCAFNLCQALKSIVLPNSVTEIGRYAFSECSALQSVTLPDSVTSIGRGIFDDSPEIKEIIIPAGTKAKFVELGLDENLLVEK